MIIYCLYVITLACRLGLLFGVYSCGIWVLGGLHVLLARDLSNLVGVWLVFAGD